MSEVWLLRSCNHLSQQILFEVDKGSRLAAANGQGKGSDHQRCQQQMRTKGALGKKVHQLVN